MESGRETKMAEIELIIKQEFPTSRCKLSVSAELLVKLLQLPPETVIQFAEFDKNNCVTFYFANLGNPVPEGCSAPEYRHAVHANEEV